MIQEKKDDSQLHAFILDGTPQSIIDRYASLAQKAQEERFGMLEEVVVIDTETTGISFNHDQLTQIAAARMAGGEIVDWFVTFVNPGKPIPADISHLTNIYDTDVADAPSPHDAVAQLASFVGDLPLVAHNAHFDYVFVTKQASGEALRDNLWIDSLDLTRIALPRLRSHRLIDLVKAFGAPISTHRADDDVRALCTIYRILLAAVSLLPSELIAYISLLTPVEEWNTGAVFAHFAQEYSRYDGDVSQFTQDDSGQTGLYVPQSPAALADSFSLRSMRRKSLPVSQSATKRDAEALLQEGEESLAFPAEHDIEEAFSASGLVGSLYTKYEQRTEQLEMSQAVRRAFSTSDNAIIEAGTGVGKSMAYLVPSALTAQNNGITVGVATKTNTLLDQLVHKELPLLSSALVAQGRPPLQFAPLKGFSHYVCLRSVERLIKQGARMVDVFGECYSQAPALAGLLSFIEQSEYDDIDALKIDYRLVPRTQFTIASHECLKKKCPFFGTLCFAHGSRRKAERSDIVVTNHSLLFCDVAADGGLLPPIRHWVLDEAHGAEREARSALSPELSADVLLRLSAKLRRESGQNIFARVSLVSHETQNGSSLLDTVVGAAQQASGLFSSAAEDLAHHMKDLLFFDTSKKSKGYDRVELWLNDQIRASDTFANLASHGQVFYEQGERMLKKLTELIAVLDDIPAAAAVQRELSTMVLDIKGLMQATEIILLNPNPAYAYSATLFKKKDKPYDVLQALLLNVGAALDERFYAHTHSVVFASATLAIADSFSSFKSAMGLDTSEFSHTTDLILPSSYDFDNRMVVYVVEDMPDPSDQAYLPALQDLLVDIHRAQNGSVLSLFTNRREMEACHSYVQERVKEDNLRVVCQKWGVSVKGLRDDFLADKHLSLMALKSFWEGFDAPGATLRGVVIPKLPFSRPTDPLSCERAEHDPQAWMHYVLPQAVLEVKQAAGRLIRSEDDYGALILTDKRLLTKGYGQIFLKSLPSKTIKIVKSHELKELLQAYSIYMGE